MDLVIDSPSRSTIISIDCAHKPGSTFHRRSFQDDEIPLPLQLFSAKDSEFSKTEIRFDVVCDEMVATDHGNDVSVRNLSNLLYNLENLRKRGAKNDYIGVVGSIFGP